MTASKTHAAPSHSRAGSPSIHELLADLEQSVAVPPTSYHNDTVYHPQTPSALPAPRTPDIDPEIHLWAGQITPTEVAKLKDPLTLGAVKRPLPPVEFTTLTKTKGHPQGFDASRSPCIEWDADKPLDTVNREFVVDSGTPFGVEGYKDICNLTQKRKAAEEDVADTRKKQRADKSSRSRCSKETTASAPSPAVKRATPNLPAAQKSTTKFVDRKPTPTPTPTATSRKSTPRPQTSQKSAAAGPSISIPMRQTRWITRAENSLMNMKEA